MLETFSNKVAGLKACNFDLKETSTQVFSFECCKTLKISISKTICERLLLIVVIYCIKNWIKLFRDLTICFILKQIHSIVLALINFHSFYHSLSFTVSLIVIFCYSLSFVVTSCHLLPLFVRLVVTRCTTRCHSLYHSLSRAVFRWPLVFTRCTIRFHSLLLKVSLVCLFISDHEASRIGLIYQVVHCHSDRDFEE